MKHGEASSGKPGISVSRIKGIGPVREKRLQKIGITCLEDVLYYFPFRYEDRSNRVLIASVRPGDTVTLEGNVTRASLILTRRKRFTLFTAFIRDRTGQIKAVWFNQPFLKNNIKKDARLRIFGKVEREDARSGIMCLKNPEYELLKEGDPPSLNMDRIVPVYAGTEGLGSRTLRNIISRALDLCGEDMSDPIPRDILKKYGYLDRKEAIRRVHFPDPSIPLQDLNNFRSRAHKTLIFEEFFLDQIAQAVRRTQFRKNTKGPELKTTPAVARIFQEILPFSLTSAQKRVLQEIIREIDSPRPMCKLLQGDVGSGKTAVALLAMVIAMENGYQSAMMAPTEVLAEQHFFTLRRFIGARYPLFLLTGGTPPLERKRITEQLSRRIPLLLVGTHALIQKAVRFSALGIAVIDEQHKFGVRQRARLAEKGSSPHLLTMTATPIPRSLAMTLYGDLDISLIDELPPGRHPVRTVIRREEARPRIYQFVRNIVNEGDQVFFVCPLVEESEKSDLRAAISLREELQNLWFPDLSVTLVHGRMRPEDKETTMLDFSSGKHQIMVATTVIEVGVDIPRARLMVIEHAERFGLAQLHQLRGRVGRGARQSYCILMKSLKCSPDGKARLEAMMRTHNGFVLAEKDLVLRGPGDFLGTRQSGQPYFRIGHLVKDFELLDLARREARKLVGNDPALSDVSNRKLYDAAMRRQEQFTS